MNEELSKLLSIAVDGLKSTTTFIAEQVPQVVIELLKYKLFEAIAWGVVMVVISVAIIRLGKRAYDFHDKQNDAGGKVAVLIIFGIGFGLSMRSVIDSTLTIAKITLSPRIYLIEYVAETIKESKQK